MTLRRATMVALVALLALFGLGGTASAQDPYQPTTGAGTVSSGTVSAGGTVTFCGAGFAPNTDVDIAVGDTVIDTVETDADGEFCIEITLTGAGTVVLTGTGVGANGEVRVVTAVVTVVAAGGLPRTGSDSILPAIALGLGLVALGTGLVYGVRRQRAMASA
jgi:LPXTG-motif cell wall-anchored protein